MTDRDPLHQPVIDVAELHDSTLELVAAAESGSADDIVRQLLRSLVGSGLTAGASVWMRRASSAGWSRFRTVGISGSWDVAPRGPQGLDDVTAERSVTPLAEDAVLVTHRAVIDLNSGRDERDDAIECLALLASSLVEPPGGPGDSEAWDGSVDDEGPRPALPSQD